MAAHRYWRIDFTNTYYVRIEEIEMHTSVGGADVCSGGTAGSSGHFGGQTPALAFDNNNSTYWESATSSGPFWVSYDFGAGNDKDIAEVSVYIGSNQEIPLTLGVSYSDNGSSWTVAMAPKTCEKWQGAAFTMVHALAGADVSSYWRLNVSAGQGSPFSVIAELELRTSVGGADQTVSGGPSNADSYFTTGYEPGKAFDNSAAVTWSSNNAAYPHWLYYRFPADVTIVEYVITAAVPTDNQYAPKTWTLQYSGDGVTWTTADTQTNVAAWSSNESRTYTIGGAAVPKDKFFLLMAA